MFSAAFPELINPLSVSAFRLDSTFYLLRPHSASSSFNSFAISHGLFDFSGYEVVKKIDVPSGPMLSIFSTGPLVIDAIGETPIGAWIPGSGSKLTIQKARSTTSTTTRDALNKSGIAGGIATGA